MQRRNSSNSSGRLGVATHDHANGGGRDSHASSAKSSMANLRDLLRNSTASGNNKDAGSSPERRRSESPEGRYEPQHEKTSTKKHDLGSGFEALKEFRKLAIKERIRHFTWTWFTMTMATGGIANVLYSIPKPFRFPHLYALGCIFFLLNIVLFFFNCAVISLRFFLYPSTFRASFLHPTESLFIPASVISFGTILINISQYGVGYTGLWLEDTMFVFYWLYCGLAILFCTGIYLVMQVSITQRVFRSRFWLTYCRWSTQTFTISKMTPVWIFPAYPLLIVGPYAGSLASKIMSPDRSLDVIVGGFILQGIGFMVSLMIYSAFLYRLMTQKLPRENLRPGMFISVGPSGFTISGLILMGQQLPKIVPKNFMGPGLGELTGQVSMIVANWVGIWLWGLALWFFFVSVGAHYSCAANGKMTFAMTWYSFIFPNTALTTSTFAVARALSGNRAIAIIGCAMTVGLICMWLFVFGMMIRAVILKQILWPQMQEDRNEGGWCEKCGGNISVHRHRRPPPTRIHSAMSSGVWEIREPFRPRRRHTLHDVGSDDQGLEMTLRSRDDDGAQSRQISTQNEPATQCWEDIARRGQDRDSQPLQTGEASQLNQEPEHMTVGSAVHDDEKADDGDDTKRIDDPV